MPARWVAWSERRGRAFPRETFATKAEATAAYKAAVAAALEGDEDSVYLAPRDFDGSDCIAVCIDGGSHEVNDRIGRLLAGGRLSTASMDNPDADFKTTGADAQRLIRALSDSEALLRSIAKAMGWDHKPREEWVGIPDAIAKRSERFFALDATSTRLEAAILAWSARAPAGAQPVAPDENGPTYVAQPKRPG